jgi:hypothetical protein
MNLKQNNFKKKKEDKEVIEGRNIKRRQFRKNLK